MNIRKKNNGECNIVPNHSTSENLIPSSNQNERYTLTQMISRFGSNMNGKFGIGYKIRDTEQYHVTIACHFKKKSKGVVGLRTF